MRNLEIKFVSLKDCIHFSVNFPFITNCYLLVPLPPNPTPCSSTTMPTLYCVRFYNIVIFDGF